MARPSRETLLALGLLLLLIAVTVLAALAESREQAHLPDLATFSSQPEGARALRLWLEEEGYDIREPESSTFEIPLATDLALVLEPDPPGIAEEEWAVLDEWVEDGGTLVFIGEGFGTAFSASHYELEIDYERPEGEITFAAPWLGSPPFSAGAVRPRASLSGPRDDHVTLVASGEKPLLLAFPRGEGLVVFGTLTYPLSNAGLKVGDNPALALNIASLAGEGGAIWFDEWHHGVRGSTEAGGGLGQWLRRTPAGRALLYSAAVLFVALVLSGRRFGRPVPLSRPGRRRAPLEHIVAVANLSRRAGHRQAVLRQYHGQLKRELGRRYRLNPTLPDDEYVAELARFRPDLDTAALARLLGRLQTADVSEGEMVTLAQQAAAWLHNGRR